ncbi:uncharacterized protein sytl2a isoform X1 [Mastacembelus armatus]|uniref:uncharacterized protein sytl2a isoform X1 n=1 Tax=Mastacembelus armatus TaxID=205130 RepID=UPI000E4568F0|nr:uncharacterized protein LOC113143134 isoform X1 [Mastacembelus armatus]
MIDLSFLTEEEQETILTVLKRDAELKRTEEQRIQNLQKTMSDKSQLKYLTGEWFYETKQLRHQDRIHGSDIIRASIRHTHKPLTILELSQMLKEKSSFISSENKEVFVPPVLRGVLQEPHIKLSNEKYQNQNLFEIPQDKPVFQSPIKQRKNPFNSEYSASHISEEQDHQLLYRAVKETQTQNLEPLRPSDRCVFRQDTKYSLGTQNESVSMPVLKNKAISTDSQDCFADIEAPEDRHTSAGHQEILKHLSTSGYTDSLFSHLDLQIPTDTLLDMMQVRFSSLFGRSGMERQDGKQLGEHSFLGTDSITPREIDNNYPNNHDLDNTGSTTAGTQRPLLNPKQVKLICSNEANFQEQDAGQYQVFGDVCEHCNSEPLSTAVLSFVSDEQMSGNPGHLQTESEDCHAQAKGTDRPTVHHIQREKLPEHSIDISGKVSDATSSTNGSWKCSSHAVSAQPSQKQLGFFRREKDKCSDVQSPQKEQVKVSKHKDTGNTQNLYQCAADTSLDKTVSVKHEAKLTGMTDVTTLQPTALQNTTFKQTEDRVPFPDRLSNLKAFCETENTDPKIIFTREEAGQYNIFDISHSLQASVENINSHLVQMEVTEDTAGRSEEKILLPHSEVSLPLDLSKEDGRYRAYPVITYEETDDYFTELQISESQGSLIIPPHSSVTFNAPKQKGSIPVFLPHSSSSPKVYRPTKINKLQHFWEKEYTGPRIINARVNKESNSSVFGNKVNSSQFNLGTCLDTRVKSNGGAQTSPHTTMSNVVLKSLKVTDKVFVTQSPDRLQLSSSGSTGDIYSTCHQNQVKADTQTEERALRPGRSQKPRLKDQNDDVRRSPAKTCHPKVLPRESSSSNRTSLEGSPLKTFPIDIDCKSKMFKEQEKLPLVQKQRKIPSEDAKQTVLTDYPNRDIISHPLPIHPEDTGTSFGNVKKEQICASSSTEVQSKHVLEKKLGSFTHLARSLIPQHDLGQQEKAHVPAFHQTKATAAAQNDAVGRPQSALENFVGNQIDIPIVVNPTTISSCVVQSKNRNSSQETMTGAWSLSLPSSDSECFNFLSIYLSLR